MINFALEEVKDIKGKIKIYKLIGDSTSYYDEFENSIKSEGTYANELNTVVTRLHEIVRLQSLPETKFRKLKTAKNEKTSEFEIKTKNLRVYLIHEDGTGRIIILGGKKTTQESDIKRFRNLKKEYLKQAQHTQIQKL